MQKLPEPYFVRFWNEHPGMPRCCFLCKYFENPFCTHFSQNVPLHFAQSLDACDNWFDKDGIPF